jgi:hypothetical protein
VKKLIIIAAFLLFSPLALAERYARTQSLEIYVTYHALNANVPLSAQVNAAIVSAGKDIAMVEEVNKLPLSQRSALPRSTYWESDLVSEEVIDDAIDKFGGQGAQMSMQGKSRFLKSDIEGLFESMYGPLGLKRNDLADATAAYWITTWMIVNKANYPPAAQVKMIRNKVYSHLVKSGALKTMDAQRQRVAQTYQWKAVLGLIALQDITVDRRALSQITDQQTRPLGFELSRTVLTKQGFVAPQDKK